MPTHNDRNLSDLFPGLRLESSVEESSYIHHKVFGLSPAPVNLSLFNPTSFETFPVSFPGGYLLDILS